MDPRHAEAAERLVEHLNLLRFEVGNPSLGRLSQLSEGRLLKSTLDDHLSRRRVRLPAWHLVAAYVAACHRAAASTGLDVKRLGTLDDWHRRYLAAVEGDPDAVCPVSKESSFYAQDDSTKSKPIRKLPNPDMSSKLAEPLGTGRHSRDVQIPKEAGTRTRLRPIDESNKLDPSLDSDDHMEVLSQGVGRWKVRWLPQESQDEAQRLPQYSVDEESTESLNSSNEGSPEDEIELALSLQARHGNAACKAWPP